MMIGSVCSGIAADAVAWGPLGWKHAWFAEIEPKASAVLSHHYKDVVNHGDFTQIKEESGSIDLLMGGTPCQSFSVAGKRAGLDDARGVLAFEFLKLAHHLRPKWLVFENVPGLLSSNGGRDFGAWLGELAKLGYGFCYRVLDAQHFGVPQRRRRIFVVGHSGGDWRRCAAALLDSRCVSGDPPPSRQTRTNATEDTPRVFGVGGKDVARVISAGSGGSKFGSGRDNQETFIAMKDVSHTITSKGHDASEDGTRRGVPLVGCVETLTSSWHQSRGQKAGSKSPPAIAYQCGGSNVGAMGILRSGNGHATGGVPFLADECCHRVRKLTPREVERCFGLPDDYTLVPYRGKSMSDSGRYQLCGNSIVVPVLRWIGERISLITD